MRVVLTLLLLGATTFGQIISGGGYTIRQSSIAPGGGTSSGGSYSVTGTVGQTVSGTTSTQGPYKIEGGFWAPEMLVPTAATAQMAGKVRTLYGLGVRQAVIRITGGQLSAPITVQTNTFGRFSVDGLLVGEAYFVEVSHRRYQFAQPIIVVNLLDSVTDIRFQAVN